MSQIPRGENSHADTLVSLGSTVYFQNKGTILVEYLEKPSIEVEDEKDSEAATIETEDNWMTPIIQYLREGWISND